MSLPSFPLTVPCPGVPFAPRGPSAVVPPLHRYYGALRLPAAPLSLTRACDLRFRLTTEQTGSPKFLGDPRHACPGSSTPVESREQASGNMSLRPANGNDAASSPHSDGGGSSPAQPHRTASCDRRRAPTMDAPCAFAFACGGYAARERRWQDHQEVGANPFMLRWIGQAVRR
jgi:hypothetical protein